MRSTTLLVLTGSLMLTSVHAQECACEGSIDRGFIAGHAGSTEQLYPFARQDPWLHGQYQRVPSYGGYSSFRPYNYRHVAPQAYMTAQFGAVSAMSTSRLSSNRNLQNAASSRSQIQSSSMPGPSSTNTSVLKPTPRPISRPRTIEPRR